MDRRRLLKFGSLGIGILSGCSRGGISDDGTSTSSEMASTSSEIASEIEVLSVETPDSVLQAHSFDIDISVENSGSIAVEKVLQITIDGETVEPVQVSLGPGEKQTVSKTLEMGYLGEHTISVGSAASTIVVEPAHSSFIERDGRHFTLDGEPIYFSGGNGDDVARLCDAYIDDFLSDSAELGLQVLRIRGHGKQGAQSYTTCPPEVYDYQPDPGQYAETAFRQLDYVIYRAKQYGIRLIITFANAFGDGSGTMHKYSDWSSTASGHDDFYTDPEAQQLYREYIKYVVNRENTYTGQRYKDDPTIFMWELVNEPHLEDPETSEEVLQNWIAETATYIKDLDSNHLVSTGQHRGPNWLENHRPDAIDACSFHFYPAYVDMNVYELSDEEFMEQTADIRYIRSRVSNGHSELDKPVYCGEFNFHAGDYLPDDWTMEEVKARKRLAFSKYYDALDTVDADGGMFFGFQSDDLLTVPYTEFGLPVLERFEKLGDIIRSFGERMTEKSGTDGSA